MKISTVQAFALAYPEPHYKGIERYITLARVETDDGTVTSTFSSIYTGWPTVENAAIAIAGAAQLIRMPGRMCQNGREVPLGDDEFMQFAREMEEVAIAAAAVAATKDRDAMIEATNNLAGGCENCRSNYRRYPEENRCQLP